MLKISIFTEWFHHCSTKFILEVETKRSLIFFHFLECSTTRRALTDKLQKGDKAPPKGTRLQVGTQLKLPFASFPDFDKLKHDEKFWAVRDVLDKIAKNRGECGTQVLIQNTGTGLFVQKKTEIRKRRNANFPSLTVKMN